MKTSINKLLSLSLPLTIAISLLGPVVKASAAPYDNGNGINQPTNGPFINNYQPLVTPEPPTNWNPLNAPDKELEFYGYPSRPSDKHQLEPWKKIVLAKFHKCPGIPYPSLGIPNTRIVQSVPQPVTQPVPRPVPQH